jgi:DNA-binding beta-propeller fold protein YncE
VKRQLTVLLVIAFLLAQPATATSYPITVAYGRSWPLSMVVDPSRGLLYVDGTSGINPPTGFSFGVINTSNNSITVLPLKVTPGDMAYDPGRDNVYVAGSDSIAVYSGDARDFVGNLTIGHQIYQMVFDARVSQDLYVTSGKKVYEINPVTGTIVANATVAGGAGGLALDPNNGRLYVADYISHYLFVFQSSGLGLVGETLLPSCCPNQLALDSARDELYATTGTNYLEVIDTKNDTFRGYVEVAPLSNNSTSGIAIDEVTGRVFVSFSTGGSIAEVGPGDAQIEYLQVTSTPASIAVDASTGVLYVAYYHQVMEFDAREGIAGPDYTLGILAGAGAAVAALVLVLVLRSQAWRNRSRPPSPDLGP